MRLSNKIKQEIKELVFLMAMIILFLYLKYQLINNKSNYEFIIFVIFTFINLIKNDINWFRKLNK